MAWLILAYVVSFTMLAVWWNNQHHLLQAAQTVSGRSSPRISFGNCVAVAAMWIVPDPRIERRMNA